MGWWSGNAGPHARRLSGKQKESQGWVDGRGGTRRALCMSSECPPCIPGAGKASGLFGRHKHFVGGLWESQPRLWLMQPPWLGVAALGLGSLELCSPPAGSPGQPPKTTECRALGRPCADPSPFRRLPACGFPPSAPFPEQFSQRKSPESTSGGLECAVPPPEPRDGHPPAP